VSVLNMMLVHIWPAWSRTYIATYVEPETCLTSMAAMCAAMMPGTTVTLTTPWDEQARYFAWSWTVTAGAQAGRAA
jgi:hypothetical protein